MRFLSDRVGAAGMARLLEYYRQINWISGDVLDELLRIGEGTKGYEATGYDYLDEQDVEDHELLLEKEPGRETESVDGGRLENREWRLSPDDHVRSLLFIMELKNEPIDRNAMTDLEQKLDSIESNPWAMYRI
jgi:flagellar protein FlaD